MDEHKARQGVGAAVDLVRERIEQRARAREIVEECEVAALHDRTREKREKDRPPDRLAREKTARARSLERELPEEQLGGQHRGGLFREKRAHEREGSDRAPEPRPPGPHPLDVTKKREKRDE